MQETEEQGRQRITKPQLSSVCWCSTTTTLGGLSAHYATRRSRLYYETLDLSVKLSGFGSTRSRSSFLNQPRLTQHDSESYGLLQNFNSTSITKLKSKLSLLITVIPPRVKSKFLRSPILLVKRKIYCIQIQSQRAVKIVSICSVDSISIKRFGRESSLE